MQLNSTSNGTKFFCSLILIAPRVLTGSVYLVDCLIKGLVGGAAFGIAKIGEQQGKLLVAGRFSKGCFEDVKRDLTKAILLIGSGILAPFGHIWTAWDMHENQGVATNLSTTNLGSLGLQKIHFFAALFQDTVHPYKKPNLKPHLLRRCERPFNRFANWITHYKGIEKALNCARDQNSQPMRSLEK